MTAEFWGHHVTSSNSMQILCLTSKRWSLHPGSGHSLKVVPPFLKTKQWQKKKSVIILCSWPGLAKVLVSEVTHSCSQVWIDLQRHVTIGISIAIDVFYRDGWKLCLCYVFDAFSEEDLEISGQMFFLIWGKGLEPVLNLNGGIRARNSPKLQAKHRTSKWECQ